MGAELAKDRADVVVARLGREEEALGDLGVPQALSDELQHLEFARREVGGVAQCRRAGPPRQPARPALAQPARDEHRGRPGAQPLQLDKRAAKRVLVLGVGQREGGLVGTADLGPQLRGPRPVAGDLDGVRFCRADRCVFPDSRAPTPVGELAGQPRGAPLGGELERCPRGFCHCFVVSFEPGSLGFRTQDNGHAMMDGGKQCIRSGRQNSTGR